ncbi:methyl-CpG binding domain protein isoform X3, partial [Silurus meridionalis]
DGWEDCTNLGYGWKRKVVFRRSGVSVGQRDVYYLSPKGERVRSKIELLKAIGNTVDLTNFDFKTGRFQDLEPSKRVTKKSQNFLFAFFSLSVCVRCRNPFTIIEGRTMCEKCSKACNASKDNRNITFRKWLPCGFCQACQLTEDCGVCASCRNGKQNPQYRRPIRCRKRKCLCPSLKGLLRKFRRSCGRCKGCVAKADCGTCDYCIDKPKFGGSNKKRQKCRQRQCRREAKVGLLLQQVSKPSHLGNVIIFLSKPHYAYSHTVLRQNSEKWDFEFSDNECERERIAKGSLVGVRYVEKDKHFIANYNGQVQTEASQAFSGDHLFHLFCDEWTRVNDRTLQSSTEETDEDEMEPTVSAKHTKHMLQSTNNRDPICYFGNGVISLGGDIVDDGLDLELLELLASLRDAPLPVLWCAVLAEGPRLQLLQCSKLSAMADTTVQIEPSFRYHISVQGQPLLPTHWLYHAHPARLTSVAQVATLLQDLERYSVCRG